MYRELSEYFNNLLMRLSADQEAAELKFHENPTPETALIYAQKSARYDQAVHMEAAIMNIVKE